MSTHTKNIYAHAAFIVIAGILSLQACSRPAAAAPTAEAKMTDVEHIAAASQIDAGRYLVKIGGCNDCHTPGYVETLAMGGKAPAEETWLLGGDVGYGGPWGVSYPANLRISLANMTEDEFVTLAREGRGRPPMPWPSLQAMSDADLKAIYAYIVYLGPAGKAAPAALSPGVEPDRPYLNFEPVMPKG